MQNERDYLIDELLDRRRAAESSGSLWPTPRPGCPGVTDVMDVALGRATPEVKGRVERHLPECDYCRACFAAYQKVIRDDEVHEPEAAGSLWEVMAGGPSELVIAGPTAGDSPDSRLDDLRAAVPKGYTHIAMNRDHWPELAAALRFWLPYLLEFVGLDASHTDGMLKYVEPRIPIGPDQRLSVLLPGWLVDFAGAATPRLTIDRPLVERIALRLVLDPAEEDETPGQRRFREAARAKGLANIEALLGFTPAGQELSRDVLEYRSHLYSRGRERAGEGMQLLQVG